MKPNKLIDIDYNEQVNMISSDDLKVEQGAESLVKKLLTSFGAILVICVVFVTTPYLIKLLPSSETKVASNELSPQKQFNPEYAEAFVWTVKLKLEDLKLNHRLQANIDSHGVIRVKGDISEQEKSNWKNFLEWYDGKKGFPKLLHSVEAIEINGNIPELKSVWFDLNPTAYFADGRFGNMGTVLDDGWKIVSIEAWAVLIERDGTMVTLAY